MTKDLSKYFDEVTVKIKTMSLFDDFYLVKH